MCGSLVYSSLVRQDFLFYQEKLPEVGDAALYAAMSVQYYTISPWQLC